MLADRALGLLGQLLLLLRRREQARTSQPTPKAISPAARGLPWVWRIDGVRGLLDGADRGRGGVLHVPAAWTRLHEPAAFDAMPWADDVVSWALPMTFSFRVVMRPLAAVTRRSTTRAGLTFSLRASTS